MKQYTIHNQMYLPTYLNNERNIVRCYHIRSEAESYAFMEDYITTGKHTGIYCKSYWE